VQQVGVEGFLGLGIICFYVNHFFVAKSANMTAKLKKMREPLNQKSFQIC